MHIKNNDIKNIINETKNIGFTKMNILSKEYKSWENYWQTIANDIIHSNDIQDVILESGRFPIYKKYGTWLEQKHLDRVITNEDINYFMTTIAKIEIGSGRPVTTPKAYLKEKMTTINYDMELTNLILAIEDKSHIFAVNTADKILRCILYSVEAQNSKNLSERYAISIRIQPKELPDIGSLNLPPNITKVMKHSSGLNLISGYAGNGKTWTLSAIINYLNNNLDTIKVISTVEEPIEFLYKNNSARIIQRQIGDNTPSVAKASEDSLRQGHDIIVISEVKNKEEFYRLLMLAESGKQVFATIHAKNLADTIERFVSEFEVERQENIRERLLENINLIVNQELVTYSKKQYPVVEMLLIDSEQDRKEFIQHASTRKSLYKLIQNDSDNTFSWLYSKKTNYNQLIKENQITNSNEVRRIFKAN